MKYFIFLIPFFILGVAFPVAAEECKDMQLTIRPTQVTPKPDLKRHLNAQSKLWFTQQTHLQKPDQVQYDTLITASNAKGSLVEILAEGHFREFAVETKWTGKNRLSVSVEWGRIVFCTYEVDVDKMSVAIAKRK